MSDKVLNGLMAAIAALDTGMITGSSVADPARKAFDEFFCAPARAAEAPAKPGKYPVAEISATPSPSSERHSGKELRLPGLDNPVYTSDPIFKGSHFTWGEATKGGTRIPENEEIVRNIITMAHDMEGIREYLGNNPVHVNSWYRDAAANAKAGGAKDSQHKKGRAVDFKAKDVPPYTAYTKLDKYWGSKGGLGRYPNFTHADNRGYKARW